MKTVENLEINDNNLNFKEVVDLVLNREIITLNDLESSNENLSHKITNDDTNNNLVNINLIKDTKLQIVNKIIEFENLNT